RALETLVLQGVYLHHALLERAVQRAERVEEGVPELLPARFHGLAEARGDDPQEVLRLLLVLPLLDLLAPLMLVDGLEREVDVALLGVDLQDLADDLLTLAHVVADVFDPSRADLGDVDESFLVLVLIQGDEGPEVLRADARPLVGLVAFPASEAEMDLLRGLLASLGLRAGEAAVAGRDPPEPPLARPEFRPRAVLHPLDLELDVLVAERTVTADTLGHLHGGGPSIDTEENCYLRVPGSPTPCPRTASTADDDRSRTAPERPVFRSASSIRRLHRNKYILLN